ncbi:hypothetical protein L1987_41798 [Smallanthus sonchifolius]|uniref:Uncharacterized protein n=1 Tax=Smallanthus sonchifolius TaxID=185202 RepID=A0ACB9GWN3_9ASTR|nr:hypothetical protein L1987_41798 [Smallanthus sonchifolius]
MDLPHRTLLRTPSPTEKMVLETMLHARSVQRLDMLHRDATSEEDVEVEVAGTVIKVAVVIALVAPTPLVEVWIRSTRSILGYFHHGLMDHTAIYVDTLVGQPCSMANLLVLENSVNSCNSATENRWGFEVIGVSENHCSCQLYYSLTSKKLKK